MSWKRALACAGIFAFVLGIFYLADLDGLVDEIDRTESQVAMLKTEYLTKRKVSANLDLYRAQMREVDEMGKALQQVLPSSSGQLLAVMQAARRHGLRVEHMHESRQEMLREFYAELPGTLRVTGAYQDLGAFVEHLANNPPIVYLEDLKLEAPAGSSVVSLDAGIRTFRYLDDEEVAVARRAASKQARSKR